MTSGDERKRTQSAYLESAEKLKIFHGRYVVEILTNKANISI